MTGTWPMTVWNVITHIFTFVRDTLIPLLFGEQGSLRSLIADVTTPLFGVVASAIIVFVFLFFILLKTVSLIDRGWAVIFHRRLRADDKRDMQRTYDRETKRKYSRYCGNRCEGTGLMFRCRNTGNLQGDHWFPYSLGGETTEKNLVMLCSRCNQRKSNKMPSIFQTYALYLRRKMMWGYTPAILPQKPGDWLTRKELRQRQ